MHPWIVYLDGAGTKRRPYRFNVRTVVDDKSDIWDLGPTLFKKVTKKSIKNKGAKKSPYDGTFWGTGAKPVVGHSYVVHTLDGDSDFWSKFTVEKIVARGSVTVSWELLTTPQRKLDQDRKKRAEEKKRRKKKSK